jgi:hypothetical protein
VAGAVINIHFIPSANGTLDLGASGTAWRSLYVGNVYGGAASLTGLAMNSAAITGLATPTNSTDAATKGYVDTFLPLAGGTITGSIPVGTNFTQNLGAFSGNWLNSVNARYVNAAYLYPYYSTGVIVEANLNPGVDLTYSLGSPTARWASISCNTIVASAGIQASSSILTDTSAPLTAATSYCGYSGNRWTYVYAGNVNYTSLTNASDRKLKKDIEDSDVDHLETIRKIRLRKYRWAEAEASEDPQIGVVAQEVHEIDPSLVSSHNDVLGVRTDRLVYALLGAVQQLTARVQELESASQSAPPLPRARSRKTKAEDTPPDIRL